VKAAVRGPGPGAITAALAEAGIAEASRLGEALWRFHQLLRAADAELNLTRLRSFDAMLERHYVDSLLPLRWAALSGRVMDLGSGGGFPGVPLALARPDVRFLFVEGRRRRVAFLQHVVEALGLANVEVVARKLNPRDRLPVDGVVVRAVARAEDLLERVAGSLAPGGLVWLWKGPGCDDEVRGVAARGLPFELAEDRAYALPRSGDPRRLLVFRRGAGAATAGEPDVEGAAGGGPAAAGGLAAVEAAAQVAGAPWRLIESAGNEHVKRWRALHSGRGSRKAGETLLAGARYVAEVIADRPEALLGLLFRAGGAGGAELTSRPWPPGVPGFAVGAEAWSAVDPEGTGGPVAWLRAPPPAAWDDAGDSGVTVWLAAQSPDNVGAVVRSAEALGARGVVLLEGAASPLQPKALRAAGPAALRLPLWQGPSLGALDPDDPALLALDLRGDDLATAALPAGPIHLVVGREGSGLQGLPAGIRRVRIAMDGQAESLNAAVATAIALYALRQRRGVAAAAAAERAGRADVDPTGARD
jgi:16S rRNA (guanine527-N7)-methyltransferase